MRDKIKVWNLKDYVQNVLIWISSAEWYIRIVNSKIFGKEKTKWFKRQKLIKKWNLFEKEIRFLVMATFKTG